MNFISVIQNLEFNQIYKMGQNLPRGNQSIHQSQHSKFEKVIYKTKPFNEQAQNMEVEFPSDQNSYKKWKEYLKIYDKQFNNKKYLLLPLNHDYHSGGMCSHSGIVKITYPKLPYILEDEIQSIKKKKNTFSEAEIWKLLHVLVEAKKQYLEFGKIFSYELGNVNAKNIFLNEQNEIKLANPLSWPNYIDGYKNAVLREPAYLSPEDMKLLELGALKNDANNRSEDFSIGMTLLSVGLVEILEHLYDFKKPQFSTKQFEERLILWKTTIYFSEILRAVVLSLLQTDPQKRLTLNEVRDFLKPHINNIQASRPLVISNVNPKIQKKVEKLINQLPDLIKYRFQKYSPERQNQGTNIQIVRTVKQSIQQDQTQPAAITRVKSQTRFTYSNQPLEKLSPAKFSVNHQKVAVSQQKIVVPQMNPQRNINRKIQQVKQDQLFGQKNKIYISPRINKITHDSNPEQTAIQTNEPSLMIYTDQMLESKKPINTAILTYAQNQTQGIAQRLVKQGLKHTNSEIHIQQSNRQSASTQINKLQLLECGNTTPLRKQPQQKNLWAYHTYEQVLVNSDFGAVWNEFLNLIHRPETYFSQLQHKITVSDQTIEVVPGKVKIKSNRQQGKIHLENMSSQCTGQILGGVSKKSPDEVQVWFNSSYMHKDKPFPTSKYFLTGLQKLKEKVENKKSN